MPLHEDTTISVNDLIQSRAASMREQGVGRLNVGHWERRLAEADEYTVRDACSFLGSPGMIRYLIEVGHTTEEIRRMWSSVREGLDRYELPIPRNLR